MKMNIIERGAIIRLLSDWSFLIIERENEEFSKLLGLKERENRIFILPAGTEMRIFSYDRLGSVKKESGIVFTLQKSSEDLEVLDALCGIKQVLRGKNNYKKRIKFFATINAVNQMEFETIC